MALDNFLPCLCTGPGGSGGRGIAGRCVGSRQRGDPVPAFTDVPSQGPLATSLNLLVSKGVINGFPDGTFRPQESLTRAQAAKVLALAAGLNTAAVAGGQSFSDVDPGHWAYGAVEAAARSGIFRGYPDGTFRPEDQVNRAEAVTLLLRLAGGELYAGDVEIADVPPNHWAYHQVATAVKAGLAELSGGNFLPELAARRGEMARGLAAVFALGPVLRTGELAGRLVIGEGKVEVSIAGGEPAVAKSGMKVSAGTKLATGPKSRAEIVFDDGSGILLGENTTLEVTGARGINFARSDGTWGMAVDRLELKLSAGKIFGALASRYEAQGRQEKGAAKEGALLASLGVPVGLDGLFLAQAETEGLEELPWWAEPYSERERVVVDMPWGVAGIRGTFWMNEVSAGGQRTSLITGKATVTAAGQAVALTAGQSTVVSREGAAPSAPSALTLEEKKAWQAVKEWVNERAKEIQQSPLQPPAPAVLPPQAPVEEISARPAEEGTLQQSTTLQQPSAVEVITKALEEATKGADTPATVPPSRSSGGGSSYKPSSNANLSGLSVSVGELELIPAFDKDTVQYAVYVGSSVASLQVAATLEDSRASLKVNGNGCVSGQPVTVELSEAGSSTTVTVVVTAEDKATQKTYTVTVYRAPEQPTGGGSGQSEEPEDTVGPKVIETDPASSPDKVPTVDFGKPIVFYFNEEIKINNESDLENLEWLDENGNLVCIDLYFDYDIKKDEQGRGILLITPHCGLLHDMYYKIRLNEGTVFDLAGNPNESYELEIKTRRWEVWQVDENADFDYTSLALGVNEEGKVCPVVSYTGSDGTIKLAYYGGENWIKETVPTVSGLAYGKKSSVWLVDGMPQVAYLGCSQVSNGPSKLVFAQKTQDGWQAEIVDENTEYVGDAALVADSSGAPHIAYYDMCLGEVKYAVRSDKGWSVETVTGGVYNDEMPGRTLSLALDESGIPHVAFYCQGDKNENGYHGYLCHAHINETSDWQYEKIQLNGSQNYGIYPTVFSTNEKLFISFYDWENGYPCLAEKSITDSDWSVTQFCYYSQWCGWGSSLAVDQWGRPHMCYSCCETNTVTYARRSEWSEYGHFGQIETVYSQGGEFTSIALDAEHQNPHIVFITENAESGGWRLMYAR